MPQNPPSPPNRNPPSTSSGSANPRGQVQGEGDYEAARRYREELKEFLEHADVEERAAAAKPDSAQQERELALAEDEAKRRSQGDDPVDVGLMYPGKRAEDAAPREQPDPSADPH